MTVLSEKQTDSILSQLEKRGSIAGWFFVISILREILEEIRLFRPGRKESRTSVKRT